MLSDDVVIYVPDDQIEEYKKVFEENNKKFEHSAKWKAGCTLFS